MDKLKLAKLVSTFAQLRPRLERVAWARAGGHATAQDILQDTWLKLETCRVEGVIDNPGGFVTQVANTTVSDHIRKERRRAEIDAELSGVLWDKIEDVSPERLVIGREGLKAVRDVLDTLPERTRQIFLMNRIEQIPHRRIAEMLGISEETVYYHIRRAIERLASLRDELGI